MSGDNFDALSNKELHTKCLEYGLPDVPVTNTSRSVILKRLRVAFYGTPKVDAKVKKTTTRRETVHVSTPAQTNKAKLNNIAENVATDLSSNSASTSRNRYTADYSYNFSISPTQHTDTDFHVNNQIVNEEPYKRIVPTIATNVQKTINTNDNTYVSPVISEGGNSHDSPHLRRSVSLTKSPVLTTSFNQEAPQRKRVETSDIGDDEDYEEEEEEEEEEVEEEDQDVDIVQIKMNKLKRDPHYVGPPFLNPETELKMLKPKQTNLYGSKPKYSTLSAPSACNRMPNSPPYHPHYLIATDFGSTSSANKQYGFTTAVPTSQLGSLNNSTKANTLYPNLPQSVYLSNSTASPDYISNTYQSNSSMRKRGRNTMNAQHKYDTNSEDDAGHSSDDYPETFNNYFSKPAARADRSTLQYESPKTRRPINTDDDDEPIRQFFQTLERKYHLKQSLALILCFVLAAFIYAFFLH